MKFLLFLTVVTAIAGQQSLQAMQNHQAQPKCELISNGTNCQPTPKGMCCPPAPKGTHGRPNLHTSMHAITSDSEELDPKDWPHYCCACCTVTLYVLAGIHADSKNLSSHYVTDTQVAENSCPTTPFNQFTTPPAYSSHPYSSYKFAQSQFSADLYAADESDENMPDKKNK